MNRTGYIDRDNEWADYNRDRLWRTGYDAFTELTYEEEYPNRGFERDFSETIDGSAALSIADLILTDPTRYDPTTSLVNGQGGIPCPT